MVRRKQRVNDICFNRKDHDKESKGSRKSGKRLKGFWRNAVISRRLVHFSIAYEFKGVWSAYRTTSTEGKVLPPERGPRGTGQVQLNHAPTANPAAVNVFLNNIAIVMGPTPPGTGVIADAISLTGP